MKLSETVELMNSDDWKDRFVAEYIQLQIRSIKLEEVLNTSDSVSTIDSMTKAIMLKQLDAMKSYKSCLEKRAVIANIDLSNKNHE